MPLDKKTYKWAEAGTKTEPASGKQQSGWVPGEQPTIGEENWIQNNQDGFIDELQSKDSPETTSSAINKFKFAQQSRVEGWAYPYSLENTFTSASSTDTLVDMTLCYIDGEKRILVLEQASGDVLVVDPLTASLDKTFAYATLAAGLTTPTTAWKLLSICADDASMYILFEETGTGTPLHYVQAYKLSDGSVKTGWTTIGTKITAANLTTEFWTGADNRTSRIIFGDSRTLVTLNSWVVSSTYSSSDPMLSSLLATDGSLLSEGAGDIASVSPTGNRYAYGGIESDWNNTVPDAQVIYFTNAQVGATLPCICSATLVDLTVGSGYPAFPYTGSPGVEILNDLIYDGQRLWVTKRFAQNAGDAYTVSGNFLIFDPITGAGTEIYSGSQSACSPRFMATDGLDMYLTGRIVNNEGTPSGTDYNSIIKTNPSAVAYTIDAASATYSIQPAGTNRFALEAVIRSETSTTRDANVDYQGPILFDGRDLWAILDIRDGATYTFGSKLYRLPRTAIR